MSSCDCRLNSEVRVRDDRRRRADRKEIAHDPSARVAPLRPVVGMGLGVCGAAALSVPLLLTDSALDYAWGEPAKPPFTLSADVFLTFRFVGFLVAIAIS